MTLYARSLGVLCNNRRWNSTICSVTARVCSTNKQLDVVPSGLLEGISNVATATHYSSNISLTSAASLVRNQQLLYNIVEADCGYNSERIDAYMKRIVEKKQHFIHQRKVCDREELFNGLNTATEIRGNFVCLLGGKSTGKSLVLREFARRVEENRPIIYVNLRQHSSITEGFVNEIRKSKYNSLIDVMVETIKNFYVEYEGVTLGLTKPRDPLYVLKDLFDSMTEKYPEYIITLVLDEANLALTINDSTSMEEVKQVRAALALFTSLTKEENKINVILVSSEHAFPFRLADPRLGFNLIDINKYIFAGDVPPNEMYKLLTEEWGLSDSLAVAVISVYGGHIRDVYLALHRLRSLKTGFPYFDSERTTNIDMCFDEVHAKDVDNLVNYLQSMAEVGFSPLRKRNDPVAELLSRHNVAGVVHATSLNVGLSQSAWTGENEYGLVPARQSTRLLIARYLVNNKLV